jgi:hypothetical protein
MSLVAGVDSTPQRGACAHCADSDARHDLAGLDSLALSAPPGADSHVLLPYLDDERTWSPSLPSTSRAAPPASGLYSRRDGGRRSGLVTSGRAVPRRIRLRRPRSLSTTKQTNRFRHKADNFRKYFSK